MAGLREAGREELIPSPRTAAYQSPDLISTTARTSDVGHHGLSVAERRQRDRHAGRLQAGHRRPRPVDRVDDEHERRVIGVHQPPVLRVPGDPRGSRHDELLERALGHLVDRERHVTAGAVAGDRPAGVRTEHRDHTLAQLARELEHELIVHEGISSVKTVSPGAERTRSRPDIRSASSEAIASPSPEPCLSSAV